MCPCWSASQYPDRGDAGYDVPRLVFLLKDLPVQVLGHMCSDRVLRRAAPRREPAVRGRPPRHGGEFVLGAPAAWNTPDAQTVTATRLYGTATATATARAWDRLHPRLTHRSAWTAEPDALPVIEDTVAWQWQAAPKGGFHVLRHTYASLMLEAGESVVTLARWLRHSSPAITLGYYAYFMPEAGSKGRGAIDGALGERGGRRANRNPPDSPQHR